MRKELDAAKYRILCEKEEMVVFMENYAPYAPIRRITNGGSKGAYEVMLKQADFQDAPYIREPYHEEWNEKIFQERLKSVCAAWIFGKADVISIWQKKPSYLYGTRNSCASGILFRFADGWTQEFEPESVPEKANQEPARRKPPKERKRQAPRRKAITTPKTNDIAWIRKNAGILYL